MRPPLVTGIRISILMGSDGDSWLRCSWCAAPWLRRIDGIGLLCGPCEDRGCPPHYNYPPIGQLWGLLRSRLPVPSSSPFRLTPSFRDPSTATPAAAWIVSGSVLALPPLSISALLSLPPAASAPALPSSSPPLSITQLHRWSSADIPDHMPQSPVAYMQCRRGRHRSLAMALFVSDLASSTSQAPPPTQL